MFAFASTLAFQMRSGRNKIIVRDRNAAGVVNRSADVVDDRDDDHCVVWVLLQCHFYLVVLVEMVSSSTSFFCVLKTRSIITLCVADCSIVHF